MDKENRLKLKIARANIEATKEQTKAIVVEAIEGIELPEIKKYLKHKRLNLWVQK